MSDSGLHNLFNRARIDDRQINELLGLARGITADGMVNQPEAEFLQKWLVANTAASSNPVIATLLHRINAMLRDGRLDHEEMLDLFDTLRRFSGGDFELGELLRATRLPVDDPIPAIDYRNSRFCFTGTFAFGSRRDCEAAVEQRGGSIGPLAQSTRFLVVGIYATDSWVHSTFGRKIEKAVAWRANGFPISIVAEEHWVPTVRP